MDSSDAENISPFEWKRLRVSLFCEGEIFFREGELNMWNGDFQRRMAALNENRYSFII